MKPILSLKHILSLYDTHIVPIWHTYCTPWGPHIVPIWHPLCTPWGPHARRKSPRWPCRRLMRVIRVIGWLGWLGWLVLLGLLGWLEILGLLYARGQRRHTAPGPPFGPPMAPLWPCRRLWFSSVVVCKRLRYYARTQHQHARTQHQHTGHGVVLPHQHVPGRGGFKAGLWGVSKGVS
jgi:hypothetical protein